MKQFLSFLLMLYSSILVNAQTTDSIKVVIDPITKIEDSIFTNPEVNSSFPDGVKGWRAYLFKNLNFSVPSMNGAPNGKYIVSVNFIVYKNGSISNVEAESRCGFGTEAEAIRVILKAPKWIPAMHKGRIVSSYRHQTITFLVN